MVGSELWPEEMFQTEARSVKVTSGIGKNVMTSLSRLHMPYFTCRVVSPFFLFVRLHLLQHSTPTRLSSFAVYNNKDRRFDESAQDKTNLTSQKMCEPKNQASGKLAFVRISDLSLRTAAKASRHSKAASGSAFRIYQQSSETRSTNMPWCRSTTSASAPFKHDAIRSRFLSFPQLSCSPLARYMQRESLYYTGRTHSNFMTTSALQHSPNKLG